MAARHSSLGSQRAAQWRRTSVERRSSCTSLGSATTLGRKDGVEGLQFLGSWKIALKEDHSGREHEVVEAAAKLAEVASIGHGDALEKLIRIAKNQRYSTYARCVAISAMSSAALMSLTKNEDKVQQQVSRKTVAVLEAENRNRMMALVQDAMGGDEEVEEDEEETWQPQTFRRSSTKAVEVPISAMMPGDDAVVGTGDSFQVQILIDCTEDDDVLIRQEAVKALGNVSSHEDIDVIDALIERKDDDLRVQVAAVRSLSKVAKYSPAQQSILMPTHGVKMSKERESVIAHLISLTQDDYAAEVREAAAEALAEVAPQGHIEATDALVKLINNSEDVLFDDDVGQADTIEVRHRGLFGKSRAHRKHIFKTEEEDELREEGIRAAADGCAIRRAGAFALGKVAAVGHWPPQKTLIDATQDAHPQVRAAATASLINVSGKESTRSHAAALRMIGDRHKDVRIVASTWLSDAAYRPFYVGNAKITDREAILAGLLALEDSNPDVRRNGAEALKVISSNTNRAVLRALSSHLEDVDSSVRRAAMDSLGGLLTNESDRRKLQSFR